MIIALVCVGIQWFLFGLNIAINGHFNWFIFPQAIAWTIWGLYCWHRFRKHEKYCKEIEWKE